MRTPRNIFVINVAISDLLLCTFTIPFTLADSLTAFWELGPEMVGKVMNIARVQNCMVMVMVMVIVMVFMQLHPMPFILTSVFLELELTQDILWEFVNVKASADSFG